MLQFARCRVPLRDDGAKILEGEEPAVHVRRGDDGGGAGAGLHECHLAEDVARGKPRDHEALASRRGDAGLGLAITQHERAAGGLAVADQGGALDEGNGAGGREEELARRGAEPMQESRRGIGTWHGKGECRGSVVTGRG